MKSNIEFPSFNGIIRAPWLYTGDRLVRDGGVRIGAGRVIEILERPPHARAEASTEVLFPEGLIHPAWVNAHAHLDLTGAAIDLPEGASFIDWLEKTRGFRSARTPGDLRQAAAAGLAEMVADGAAAVADFSFEGLSQDALARVPVRSILFRETIGLEPSRRQASLAAARQWLDSRPGAAAIEWGLAPHAPYSAHARLIQECRAACRGRPLSIHIAEDAAERRFLADGSGQFRNLLRRLAIPDAAFEPPGTGPIEYLDRLGVLDPWMLLVHANDLRPDEIECIAARGAAVVFCPGTHLHFNRPPHPLPDLLQAGVPVGLGTDSSASNRALSMGGEARAVRRLFPGIKAEVIFALASGRMLKQFFPGAGILEAGAPATLAIADLGGDAGCSEPLEAFLTGTASNQATLQAGHVLEDKEGKLVF